MQQFIIDFIFFFIKRKGLFRLPKRETSFRFKKVIEPNNL